eukprot:CAMPEP_0197287470 /NCGR_PEP_ID=MMETSP0890-20130614/3850_1 /TAXON_ID=44058 ORGANISM="Aureoumbra lagunensis, Strain CCMP1510" /NCGR_SAMPLE_ID=MMETSP0890 /ASSEMBLY_ACC=CAM_ASM_000533 /LENGTH=243 /DNA_ID=CAMNT_0042757145 /DNA_START=135 /DNA_END=866 /DNA_ORIENTATION=+
MKKGDPDPLQGLIDDDPVAKLLDDGSDDALLDEDDDESESLLLDDLDTPGLELEEDDDDDDDDVEEVEDELSPDSLAELLQMGQLGTGESLQDEWERRKREHAVKKEREANTLAKRKQKDQQLRAFEESRGIGFLTDDPVCRAVVACVTTGSTQDNATVASLNQTLYQRFGDKVILTHNPDPEPEPDQYPFFEVWLEGYRQLVLHARNWQNDGDLTLEKIHLICDQVEAEISEDAAEILGTYT